MSRLTQLCAFGRRHRQPADGYGYRVTGSKTVKRDQDYSFTVTFVDGFKAGKNFRVVARQILSQELLDQGYAPEEIVLTLKNGKYTIPTVQKDYQIVISGVEAVSRGVTATVSFGITQGYNEFHVDPRNDNLMLDQTFTVPYFDLSLYGLERYYYNPYCYVDENGNLRGIYLNYVYPLGYPGWGSTSDQILIENGDVISVHMITGNASGSRFGFFVVNDTDKKYTTADTIDTFEVDQGELLNLTLYWTSTTGDYSTGYERMGNKELYWISADDATEDVRDWNRSAFGKTAAAAMVTDSNGMVYLNTAGVEPGVYYIAAQGGFTAGGAVDNGGFQSAGGETGPAVFKLIVNEYQGQLGDVNNDGQITGADALVVQRYIATLVDTVNASVADFNGDGQVTGADALAIQRYAAGLE